MKHFALPTLLLGLVPTAAALCTRPGPHSTTTESLTESAAGVVAAAATLDKFILTGRVVDEAGEVVAGATVWTVRADGRTKKAKTNAQGEYALAGVSTEGVDSEAVLGWWAGSNHHFVKPLTLESHQGGGVVTLDVVLESHPWIDVHLVTSSGSPAMPELLAEESLKPHLRAELLAVATDAASGAPLPTFPYVGGFRYGVGTLIKDSVHGPAADVLGRVTLNRAGPVKISLVAFQSVLATKTVATDESDVTFELDPADLTALFGSVTAHFAVASDDRALPGQAWIVDTPSAFTMGRTDGVRTNSEGALELTGVLPGKRWVKFRPDSIPTTFPSRTLQVEVPAGGTCSVGQVSLGFNARLVANAADAQGVPRKTAIRLHRITGASSGLESTRAIYVGDDEGLVRASVEEAGMYQVEVSGTRDYDDPDAEIWCGGITQVYLSGRDAEPFSLVVQRGVPVKVLSPTLAAGLHTGLSVRFVDSLGVVRHPPWTPAGYRLAPGTYEVSIDRNGASLATQKITVASDPVLVYFPLNE